MRGYRCTGVFLKVEEIVGLTGVQEAEEMVFYTLCFLWCDFIGEDICCAVYLHGIAIDDLAV
jgi:hypothetical protein